MVDVGGGGSIGKVLHRLPAASRLFAVRIENDGEGHHRVERKPRNSIGADLAASSSCRNRVRCESERHVQDDDDRELCRRRATVLELNKRGGEERGELLPTLIIFGRVRHEASTEEREV